MIQYIILCLARKRGKRSVTGSELAGNLIFAFGKFMTNGRPEAPLADSAGTEIGG
jgi:hypothetical protein